MTSMDAEGPILSGEYRIRRMESADVDAVLQLQSALAFQDWNQQQFLHEIESAQGYPLVAECGTIIGYAVFRMVPDGMELESIAVHPSRQKQGLGRILFAAGLDYLREQNSQAVKSDSFENEVGVFLEVRAGNQAAIAFYKRLGFSHMGMRKAYYRDGENAMLMRFDVTVPKAHGGLQ